MECRFRFIQEAKPRVSSTIIRHCEAQLKQSSLALAQLSTLMDRRSRQELLRDDANDD